MHRTRSPSPKSIGMCHLLDSPSPSPKSIGMCHLLDTPSPSSSSSSGTRSRSPQLIGLFHLVDIPSSSSESAHQSGTHGTRSPSPRSINLCHLLDTPSPQSEPADGSDMRGTNASSPAPGQNSDFGIPEPMSPGPQEDGGTQVPLSSESHIVGSSSEPRRKFQTASSSVCLTLVLAGWIWGEPAPPPIESRQNDQSGSAEEVECTGSSVRHAVHVLWQLLRNADSRIIPIVTGRSCVSGQKHFEKSAVLFQMFIGWRIV